MRHAARAARRVVRPGPARPAWATRLNAVAWLAAHRPASGSPLRAGDIVLSGALGPMVAGARRATDSRADIDGLGQVTRRLRRQDDQ